MKKMKTFTDFYKKSVHTIEKQKLDFKKLKLII